MGILKEDLVTPFGAATASQEKSILLKKQCLTCSRWLGMPDLLFGLCPYCLEERAKNKIEKFRPQGANGQDYPKCYECKTNIYLIGLETWDVLAKSWKVLCPPCGQRQIEKDRQYLETPWGYEQKLR